MTQRRDELRGALRTIRRPRNGWWNGSPTRFPFGVVHEAMTRRDLMRISGNTDEAARWQAIVARHAQALGDRDRVVGLMLWRELVASDAL